MGARGGSQLPVREAEDEMKTEERVRYLLRAAGRAEGEGNLRAANVLRRMAREVQPPDTTNALWGSRVSGGSVTE